MAEKNPKTNTIAPYLTKKGYWQDDAALAFGGGIIGIGVFAVASWVNGDLATAVHAMGAYALGAVSTPSIGRWSKSRRYRSTVISGVEQANATILEITGDQSQSLNADQLHNIMENKAVEPVRINGVDGLQIISRLDQGSHNETKREIAVQVKSSDNGVDSFDHLIEAAINRNPDIAAVGNLYRKDS